eukprot:TRINITY_DN10751_c0_g1_i1.p1 TRINITY_DN10751_c0_g1~~TRINITY_DN10751_c0_g1_i1.p1  ORF type:complete len:155 (-),score=36.29 TRINITY_DN10751_c0_g1_i1:44-508(-)
MRAWVVLSLLGSTFAAPRFESDNLIERSKPQRPGASLPSNAGFEWHFNQMGVLLDLALKDQMVGGKAHVELPISSAWGLLDEENPMMKTMVDALGPLYDVQTVKLTSPTMWKNFLRESLTCLWTTHWFIRMELRKRQLCLSEKKDGSKLVYYNS